MTGNITFTMIKPDAFAAGNAGSIIQKITENGFKIKALRLEHLQKADAEAKTAEEKQAAAINALPTQMTQMQSALCDVYEQLLSK